MIIHWATRQERLGGIYYRDTVCGIVHSPDVLIANDMRGARRSHNLRADCKRCMRSIEKRATLFALQMGGHYGSATRAPHSTASRRLS